VTLTRGTSYILRSSGFSLLRLVFGAAVVCVGFVVKTVSVA